MICNLFNENELMAFLQLRYIKIRELRETLLEYMNYFRSIEKRLNYDVKALNEYSSSLFEPKRPVFHRLDPNIVNAITENNKYKLGKE